MRDFHVHSTGRWCRRAHDRGRDSRRYRARGPRGSRRERGRGRAPVVRAFRSRSRFAGADSKPLRDESTARPPGSCPALPHRDRGTSGSTPWQSGSIPPRASESSLQTTPEDLARAAPGLTPPPAGGDHPKPRLRDRDQRGCASPCHARVSNGPEHRSERSKCPDAEDFNPAQSRQTRTKLCAF